MRSWLHGTTTVRWALGRDAGWITVNGHGLHYLTPACRPLFSEREGHRVPFLRAAGWRLFRLRPEKHDCSGHNPAEAAARWIGEASASYGQQPRPLPDAPSIFDSPWWRDLVGGDVAGRIDELRRAPDGTMTLHGQLFAREPLTDEALHRLIDDEEGRR